MLKILQKQRLEVPIFFSCPLQFFDNLRNLKTCVVKIQQIQKIQVSPWSGPLLFEAFCKLTWLGKMQKCVVKSVKSKLPNNQSFQVNSYPRAVTHNSVKVILVDILLLCKTWKFG